MTLPRPPSRFRIFAGNAIFNLRPLGYRAGSSAIVHSPDDKFGYVPRSPGPVRGSDRDFEFPPSRFVLVSRSRR